MAALSGKRSKEYIDLIFDVIHNVLPSMEQFLVGKSIEYCANGVRVLSSVLHEDLMWLRSSHSSFSLLVKGVKSTSSFGSLLVLVHINQLLIRPVLVLLRSNT